jgi:hypothetical protein
MKTGKSQGNVWRFKQSIAVDVGMIQRGDSGTHPLLILPPADLSSVSIAISGIPWTGTRVPSYIK